VRQPAAAAPAACIAGAGGAALAQLPPLFGLPLAGLCGDRPGPGDRHHQRTAADAGDLFGWLARLRCRRPQRIALQNVAQAPLMAQVAASGLIVSFALTASMVIMVSSFRVAVDHWLDHVLPAPLYLRSKATPLPQELLAALARPMRPSQGRAERHASLTHRPAATARCAAGPRDRSPRPGRTPAVHRAGAGAAGGDARGLDQRSDAGDLPHRTRQTLRLPLLGRESRSSSAASGATTPAVRRPGDQPRRLSASRRRLPARPTSRCGRGPERKPHASAWLAPWADQYGLEVADSAEIRRLSLSIFDKSFAVTYALEAAAMLIGLFGLAVTLTASVWLRARELATLGALGFDRRMLSRAVMLEGALIASVGLLLGLACGVAYRRHPDARRQSAGFPLANAAGHSLARHFSPAPGTLAAAVLASRHAARQATRLPVAQVLASAQ
jgi:putative ABC transport system permease protein